MPAFDFQSYITDIPDYPKPGVIFKDATTLFKDPEGFSAAIDAILSTLRVRASRK